MSDDDVTLGIALPLDTDGFLRRECPTCEREFKWFPNPDPESDGPMDNTVPDEAGYYCPYCGVQAPADGWLTKAQVEAVENMAALQVVGPMLKDFGRNVESITRKSGGLVEVSMDYDEPEELAPLDEMDDMRIIAFACHPSEPIKVLEDWTRPVRCLVCGEHAGT